MVGPRFTSYSRIQNCFESSASNQDWKYYVEFVNDVVVDGLAQVVVTCLEFLIEQFDPEVCERNETEPMLELELQLKKDRIMFVPELGDKKEAGPC